MAEISSFRRSHRTSSWTTLSAYSRCRLSITMLRRRYYDLFRIGHLRLKANQLWGTSARFTACCNAKVCSSSSFCDASDRCRKASRFLPETLPRPALPWWTRRPPRSGLTLMSACGVARPSRSRTASITVGIVGKSSTSSAHPKPFPCRTLGLRRRFVFVTRATTSCTRKLQGATYHRICTQNLN